MSLQRAGRLCRAGFRLNLIRGLLSLVDVHRVETEVISHQEFPVDDLRRQRLTDPPSRPYLIQPAKSGALADGTVLWAGVSQLGDQLVLRLRYRTDVIDADCAARIAGYYLTALSLIAADPDVEHRRQTLLSAEELDYQIEGLAGPRASCPIAGSTNCSNSVCVPTPMRLRACTVIKQLTYRELNARANRLARALSGWVSPRSCGCCGDRAQPGLDDLRPRNIQSRRRVSSHRAAFPGRSHCDDALTGRMQARADRA